MGTIFLREARENCRMSVEEASVRTGLPVKALKSFERNFGKAAAHYGVILAKVYDASLNHISLNPDPLAGDEVRKIKMLPQK